MFSRFFPSCHSSCYFKSNKWFCSLSSSTKSQSPSNPPFGRWSPGHNRTAGRNPPTNQRASAFLRVNRNWRELWTSGCKGSTACTWEWGAGNWLCPTTYCNIFLIADNWSEYKPNWEQMHALKSRGGVLAVSLFSLGEGSLRGSVQLRMVWGGIERQPLPHADSSRPTQHVKTMSVLL